MSDPKTDLTKILTKQERLLREGVERLLELTKEGHEDEIEDLRAALYHTPALLGCLRRLTEVSTPSEIHKAFGAPGDFGYHTPLGDALYRFYRAPEPQVSAYACSVCGRVEALPAERCAFCAELGDAAFG